jgi:glycosyl transferase family 25
MKAFIIRLSENHISEKYAKECVDQAQKFGVQVEYFDAIHGDHYQKHLALLNIKPKYKFKKKRPGVYGCFLSHYYLWKRCASENVPFLILEHDGYFIRQLPDGVLDNFDDVLKLDRLDPFSDSYNTLINEESSKPLKYIKYYHDSSKLLEKHETGNYMKGAYSYIIKPNAANKIISWIAKNGFVPADQQIGDAIVDIRAISPTVVRLHPDYFKKIDLLSLTKNTNLLHGNA